MFILEQIGHVSVVYSQIPLYNAETGPTHLNSLH